MRDDPHRQRLRRLGRRLGIAAFAAIVAGLTALWTVEIIVQVWSPPADSGSVKAADCRSGILGLVAALRRARDAAAEEPNGERAALARFRQALLPEWDGRAALDLLCHRDPAARQTLSQVSALRYAEEHAVRYEAVALAEQRRRVEAMARSLLRKEPAF